MYNNIADCEYYMLARCQKVLPYLKIEKLYAEYFQKYCNEPQQYDYIVLGYDRDILYIEHQLRRFNHLNNWPWALKK